MYSWFSFLGRLDTPASRLSDFASASPIFDDQGRTPLSTPDCMEHSNSE